MKIKELVKKCIRGDTKAQKELYDIFAPKMLSVCNRYANNYHDARDIFQEGFLKVFENIGQLKDINALEWWMKRIFINEALKLYNRQKKIILSDSLGKYLNATDDFNIYNKIRTDEVTKLIQQLPTKMRTVFNMYIIEGFSHREIAELLNISEGTSKSNLHDARKRIQNKLAVLEKERLLG